MAKLSDVAKKAGVGVGTVSRVLNNSGPVSEKTRERVMSVIDDLSYVPNETARTFKTQNPKIVAIFIPSIWHPFYSKFAFFVEDEINKYGYKVMICSSSNLPTKELEYLNMLKQNKISGAICISYNDIEKYIDNKSNIVFIDRIFKKNITYVASNNYQGGQLAAEYFSRCDYKSVAYVGTYSDTFNTEIKYRKQGYKDSLKKYKINYIEYIEKDPIGNVSSMIEKILLEKNKYQAVFIENDLLAAEFYSRAVSHGIDIPNELSIVGYDGIQSNNFFRPLLSTIVQPVEEMARLCVSLIMKKLNNEPIKKRNLLDVNLFIGETSPR